MRLKGKIQRSTRKGIVWDDVSVEDSTFLKTANSLSELNSSQARENLGVTDLLNNKVDKIEGKGLSANDFTTAEKDKLSGVASGATQNDSDANLKNRANHTGSQSISTITGLQTALDGKQPTGSYANATHSHSASDINSGTFDIARIPTGTTSTAVSLGNHTHSDLHTRQHSITSTSDHSFPGGTATFLRADGTFATPGGGSDPFVAKLILGSDVSTGANVTPVNLTGMTFNYEAGATYVIEFYMVVTAAAATTGHGFGLNCTTAPVLSCGSGNCQLANTGTTTAWQFIANNAIAGVTSGMPTANANTPSFGQGVLRTHATNAGTCQFIFRSETTAVTTCKAGSVITIMKVS